MKYLMRSLYVLAATSLLSSGYMAVAWCAFNAFSTTALEVLLISNSLAIATLLIILPVLGYLQCMETPR